MRTLHNKITPSAIRAYLICTVRQITGNFAQRFYRAELSFESSRWWSCFYFSFNARRVLHKGPSSRRFQSGNFLTEQTHGSARLSDRFSNYIHYIFVIKKGANIGRIMPTWRAHRSCYTNNEITLIFRRLSRSLLSLLLSCKYCCGNCYNECSIFSNINFCIHFVTRSDNSKLWPNERISINMICAKK